MHGVPLWDMNGKCREVKTGFWRKRLMQTCSFETVIGWKSGKTTYVHLWDRMEGEWLRTRNLNSGIPGRPATVKHSGTKDAPLILDMDRTVLFHFVSFENWISLPSILKKSLQLHLGHNCANSITKFQDQEILFPASFCVGKDDRMPIY